MTPGVTSTVYNFSCTNACNYWVFYILDYPVRMSGCKSTLPCKVDTVSVSDLAKVARSEIGYKSNSNSAISINATHGNLKMVVQCVITNTYVDGMMVRVGKSFDHFKNCMFYSTKYSYSLLLLHPQNRKSTIYSSPFIESIHH